MMGMNRPQKQCPLCKWVPLLSHIPYTHYFCSQVTGVAPRCLEHPIQTPLLAVCFDQTPFPTIIITTLIVTILFVERFLSARHCSKKFTFLNLFNPHNNTIKLA